MFVHFGLFLAMLVRFLLHTGGGFLSQQGHAVRQAEGAGRIFSHGGEDLFHPVVTLTPGIKKKIRLLNIDDVPGRRLITVAFASGGQKQAHLRRIASQLAGKVIGREDRAHDGQRRFRGKGGRGAGCAEQRCAAKEHKQSADGFHRAPHFACFFRQASHRP